MQEISTPSPTLSWEQDFTAFRRTRLIERVEEFSALDRLSLSDITPLQAGFVLRLHGGTQLQKWFRDRSALIREHFLLQSVELNTRYADQLIFTRDTMSVPAGALAAVCSSSELPQAAEYLRVNCRESAGRSPYGTVVLPSYIEAITQALKIPRRPLNSTETPAWSETRWGCLLRIDSGTAEKTLAYLVINPPTDSAVTQVALGANCFAVASLVGDAPSTEPLQVRLCSNLTVDLAQKDARRWLRSFIPRPNKKTFSTTS